MFRSMYIYGYTLSVDGRIVCNGVHNYQGMILINNFQDVFTNTHMKGVGIKNGKFSK